jgi:hypothetical protein
MAGTLDLRAVREALGLAAGAAGFNAWDYMPDDVQNLPAAVVGAPREMEALTLTRWRLQLPVTFYVSSANPKDANERLDRALSIGLEDEDEVPRLSFLDTLADAIEPPWKTARFVSAQTSRYTMPGNSVAWGTEVLVEVTTT